MGMNSPARTGLARRRQRGFAILALVALLFGCEQVGPSGHETMGRSAETGIPAKIERIKVLAPAWVTAGGDRNKLDTRMKEFERLMQSGKQDEADATLDEVLQLLGDPKPTPQVQRAATAQAKPVISSPKAVRLTTLPPSAELVFPADGFIYVMDRNGGNVTQITFGQKRSYEHVAVSFNRRFVAANQPEGGRSILWLYDLDRQTEAQLVPDFVGAGMGGFGWDSQGYLYFGGATAAGKLMDVYKIKSDGTGLTQLTNTLTAAESDVRTSPDGQLVSYIKNIPQPSSGLIQNEIWVMKPDGTEQRLVKRAARMARPGIGGVADPEITGDGQHIVFSEENQEVPPNWPSIPGLATAHDIWIIGVNGTGLRRITEPGPISIIPHWKDNFVIYTELNGKDNYKGTVIIRDDGTQRRRIRNNAGFATWIR